VALKGWFPANAATGYQLVYPARDAAAIANRTDERVIASDSDSGKAAQLVVVDPLGGRTPWQPAS
jgi:hypothetical protein